MTRLTPEQIRQVDESHAEPDPDAEPDGEPSQIEPHLPGMMSERCTAHHHRRYP